MKKFIGVYLCIQALLRIVAFFVSLTSDGSQLPLVIFITSGVLVVWSLYIAVLIFLQKARLRQISRLLGGQILIILFNIVFMSFQPVEMLPTDVMVTGNLFELLVAVLLMMLLVRQKHYIRAKYIFREEEDTQTEEQTPVGGDDDNKIP